MGIRRDFSVTPRPASSAPQRLALPFLQPRTPLQIMKKEDERQKAWAGGADQFMSFWELLTV